MIKEIIVVEGKDDTTAIMRAVEAETIETGGSAINDEIIERIRLAQHRRGVIIFTDPDYPGERIRSIIRERVPGCKHAFIDKEHAQNHRKKVGVEYASSNEIIKALRNVKTEYTEPQSEISTEDLILAGLICHADAAERRKRMGKALGIGYANGKQFLKRCSMFHISKNEFVEALVSLEKDGNKYESKHG